MRVYLAGPDVFFPNAAGIGEAKKEICGIDQQKLLTYLRLRDVRLGLLINFHERRLVDGVQRVVNRLPE